MGEGVLLWFDDVTGRGRVRAGSGRELPVSVDELPTQARAPGVRVRFDVDVRGGIAYAVRVVALEGTRSSRRQRRHGDLVGAGRPEEKLGPALTHGAPDRPTRLRTPSAVLERWVRAATSQRLDDLLGLYAPDAVLHAGGREWRGRGAVRDGLMATGTLGVGWDPEPRGSEQLLVLQRGPRGGRVAEARFRIGNGEIVEQWVAEAA